MMDSLTCTSNRKRIDFDTRERLSIGMRFITLTLFLFFLERANSLEDMWYRNRMISFVSQWQNDGIQVAWNSDLKRLQESYVFILASCHARKNKKRPTLFVCERIGPRKRFYSQIGSFSVSGEET